MDDDDDPVTGEDIRQRALQHLQVIAGWAAADGATVRRIVFEPGAGKKQVWLTTDPTDAVDDYNTAGAET